MITNNFQQVLGKGGFGYVYNGFLENGIQVAVKLRSHSSNQGVKEFLAEVILIFTVVMFTGSTDLGVKFDRLYTNLCPGSNFDTDSSHESCHHDWLLQGWGVHGTCL
jgi:predicted Ser/Thr protein kinase